MINQIPVVSCSCTGTINCGATACDKGWEEVVVITYAGTTATNGYYLGEVKPPRPTRRDRGFLDDLSRRKQQQERRRFRRL